MCVSMWCLINDAALTRAHPLPRQLLNNPFGLLTLFLSSGLTKACILFLFTYIKGFFHAPTLERVQSSVLSNPHVLILPALLSESFCGVHDSDPKPDERPALFSVHWNFPDKFRASGEYQVILELIVSVLDFLWQLSRLFFFLSFLSDSSQNEFCCCAFFCLCALHCLLLLLHFSQKFRKKQISLSILAPRWWCNDPELVMGSLCCTLLRKEKIITINPQQNNSKTQPQLVNIPSTLHTLWSIFIFTIESTLGANNTVS